MVEESTSPKPASTSTEGKSESLNPKQIAFVREYLIDLNATQAAIRAGYSPATAGQSGHEYLNIPKIAEAIAVGKAQRLSRVNMTQDTVLEEMAALAKSSLDDYDIDDRGNVVLAEGAPRNAMAAVQSIKKKIRHDKDGVTYEVELRLWDKPGPLKLMGKHAGVRAFSDRVEHTGKDGAPIEFAQLTTEELLARHRELSEVAPEKAG